MGRDTFVTNIQGIIRGADRVHRKYGKLSFEATRGIMNETKAQ